MAYAYMLRCSDGSLYSGYTVDLQKRLQLHNSGRGAKYTRSRLPVTLVYFQEFSSIHEALQREAALKRLSRQEKLQLIAAQNNKPED